MYLGHFTLNGPVVARGELSVSTQDALNRFEFLARQATSTYGAAQTRLGCSNLWTLAYFEKVNEDDLSRGNGLLQVLPVPNVL